VTYVAESDDRQRFGFATVCRIEQWVHLAWDDPVQWYYKRAFLGGTDTIWYGGEVWSSDGLPATAAEQSLLRRTRTAIVEH